MWISLQLIHIPTFLRLHWFIYTYITIIHKIILLNFSIWENRNPNNWQRAIKKAVKQFLFYRLKEFRQRPILPGSHPPSIVGVTELNFRVRDGNGCDLCTIATGSLSVKDCTFKTKQCKLLTHIYSWIFLIWSNQISWLSPRSISTAQLHASLHFHLRPINDVVFIGPYLLAQWDILS